MVHTTCLTVRYGETDMFGHVNNAVYLSYLEEARLQFMEDLGFVVVPLILASVKADFRAQAFFKQKLVIETAVDRIGNSSFDLVNRIKDEAAGQLIVEALVTMVHFNFDTKKSELLPGIFREKLSQYLGK
ncbi:acyl-CoA thioesterase [Effusibacillus consociatus]|uniref:Acyl-CoA thioesterase n=1 Tax=Effusibacillus consociatus TaxID=1117041 RepID=A0ABV9PV95_9BACL